MGRVFGSLKVMLPVLCIGILVGCAGDSPLPPGDFPEEGEPVSLSFDLFRGTETRAVENGQMAAGKMFRIYAYPAGTTNFSAPTGSENYIVQSDLTATGNLKLYRGTYDMYLVSYNSSTEVPVLESGDSKIHVVNGKDFMYTKLENVVVQPDQTGQSMMKVTLPGPFTRMGAQVITTVAAKNGVQPVQPVGLVVNYVKINGLYGELLYRLNSAVWDAVTGAATDASYTFDGSGFSANTGPNVFGQRKSAPGVLLPVDGSVQKLQFDVNLTVSYYEGDQLKTMTDMYKASIEKSLLAGMAYQFDFTLTFYGAIIPTDLTLAIREWTTTKLTGEELGKD